MRKTVIGLAFIALAFFILFQGHFGLPIFDFNLWPVLLMLGFAYFSLESFLKRNLFGGFILGYIALVIANSQFHFFQISNGTLFGAGLLACIGLSLIYKPRKGWYRHRFLNSSGFSSTEDEIAFGSGTRYIHSDNFTYEKLECAFGSATVYFDNAKILGDSAVFNVDLSFGSATLYVPSNWRVELDVDNAFGTVVNPHNVNPKDKTLYIKGGVAFGSLKIIYT